MAPTSVNLLLAEDAYRRCCYEEEDAYVEVEDLQAATEWQTPECEHRCCNDQIGGQIEEELVDVVESDKLLDEHLEHVGNTLYNAVGAYSVRTEAALEEGAYFTLKVYEK